MKKAVSYALFGHGKAKVENSFDFISYLRSMLYSVRMNKILFPDWVTIVQTDEATYKAYKKLFDKLPIVVEINDPEPLTKAMLWRMKPVFQYNEYSHVLCRDLDAPMTYREAQCIQEWINSDLAAHAITDSVSHDVPMLGGMIGFNTGYWPMYTGFQHFGDMFKGVNLDFSRKGMDQWFLKQYVYPKFADPSKPSIMQHYILGHPQTFLPGFRNIIKDEPVEWLTEDMKESNESCSHMGQAGWLLPQAFRFFNKHKDKLKDILQAEKEFPDVAYWVKDGTFT